MDNYNSLLKWIKNPASFLNTKLFDVKIKIFLSILMIILLGFWPVSSGFFSLKNDEIIYFLPYRYNIVESLRSGHFPLWSPYIYMGFPISGDMQSGAWNPVVWLLALTGRYTLSTLHAELLIYIYFAAVGMFKLMRVLHFRSIVCFTTGISYAFSGFIVDSGQFMCWVSCACFLPYTYLYFVRLLEHPSYINSAKFAVANFCLLIAGGYPFFFIANIYFLAIALVAYFIISRRNNKIQPFKITFKYLASSVLLFALLSTAPLLCFIHLLPYYARGTHLPLEAALYNSYSLFSTISLLFPFSITREHTFFGNNIVLSRNLYIGILLLPFVLRGMVRNRTIAWNTVFICITLAFVCSLGEVLPFRRWSYYFLPLMNTFRHPSNFRLFIIIGLLCFGAKGLNEFLSLPKKEYRHAITRILYLIILCMLVLGICFVPLDDRNPFNNLVLTSTGFKRILTNISFRQGVLFSLLLQVPFLIAAILLFIKKKYYSFCLLSLVNVIVLSQSQLLTSTVSKDPIYKINEFIRAQPKGFPIPELTQPVFYPDEKKVFLYEYKEPLQYFFNKKIAINTFINNPTILKTYDDFLKDSSLTASVKNYPFLFLADNISSDETATSPGIKENHSPIFNTPNTRSNTQHDIKIVSFNPIGFALAIRSDTVRFLVILQNYFNGWKASTGSKELPIVFVNGTFMGLKIPAGTYQLNLSYAPDWLIPGVTFSTIGFLLILYFLLFKRKETGGNPHP